LTRLLVIDACVSHRVAPELVKRGRPSSSWKALKLGRLADDDLLRRVAEIDEPWVLVTADDKMPAEWTETISELGATIATIEGLWEKFCQAHNLHLTQEQFIRDSVHRWSHVMQGQEQGEIRRYNPLSHAVWKPRKRYE